MSDYPTPCETAFQQLAEHDPDKLLQWIASDELRPEDLTFAAEACKKIADQTAVRNLLLPLLHHPSPVVREGALYGLFADRDPATRLRVIEVARSDRSPGVRDAADEWLRLSAKGRRLP